MPKSKIKFFQRGPSSIGDKKEIEIKWIVENNTEFTMTDVRGLAQFHIHEFGDIEPHSKVETDFKLPIPSLEDIKTDYGVEVKLEDPFIINASTLEYTIKTDTFTILSNQLKIPI